MDFDGDLGALRAYEAVVELPRASDLAAVARAVTIRAFESRGRDPIRVKSFAFRTKISLPRSEGDTEFGNVLDVLNADQTATRSVIFPMPWRRSCSHMTLPRAERTRRIPQNAPCGWRPTRHLTQRVFWTGLSARELRLCGSR